MAFFQSGATLLESRHLAVSRHHEDLSAEMFFVEAESLFAITTIVEVGVKLHRAGTPFAQRSVNGENGNNSLVFCKLNMIAIWAGQVAAD